MEKQMSDEIKHSEETLAALAAQKERFDWAVTKLRDSLQGEVKQLRDYLVDIHDKLTLEEAPSLIKEYIEDIVGTAAIKTIDATKESNGNKD
jgi:hypothetical protein